MIWNGGSTTDCDSILLQIPWILVPYLDLPQILRKQIFEMTKLDRKPAKVGAVFTPSVFTNPLS